LGNPLTSSHAGVHKALYVLEVLKGLPAGDVIYQQVEQILTDLQESQAQVERTYHVIAHALLDAYLQHLNPATPLYIQVSILQRRLQPPIFMSDLNAMRTQVDLYADHILSMHDLDPQKVQDSLSVLLESVDAVTRGEASEEMEPTQSMEIPESMEPTHPMEIPQSMETTHFMKIPKSSDNGLLATSPDTTTSAPAVSDNNHLAQISEQDLGDKATMIDEGLQNSISQNQEIGVVLDLLSSELVEMEQKEGIEPLRARMKELVHKLKSSQGHMVGQLQSTIDYLNSAVGDRDKLDEELQRVRQLSMTDELTGLPNRRAFMDRLENEIGRVKRHRESLSLILLDLDYFKNVNDTYGHAVGDQVLKCYANEVFSLFRQYDMVARYGGEEFAVLSPNTDMEGALCALSKAMDRVKKLRFEHNGSYITVPTFSAGVAVYRDGEQIESFLQRADQALYQAKSLGRNRIEVANV
jgi:diguanylate cyclase (GGDEF)-like protein